jgi:hypothetical protein
MAHQIDGHEALKLGMPRADGCNSDDEQSQSQDAPSLSVSISITSSFLHSSFIYSSNGDATNN